MLKCNASAGVFAKRLGEHHVRRWCVAVVNLLRDGMRVLVVGLDAGSPLHEAASYLIGLGACPKSATYTLFLCVDLPFVLSQHFG